jgi:hypothetical protein
MLTSPIPELAIPVLPPATHGPIVEDRAGVATSCRYDRAKLAGAIIICGISIEITCRTIRATEYLNSFQDLVITPCAPGQSRNQYSQNHH